ncbi:MAG: glycosyl hydrolase family 35 [Hamadaea sp.]|uniref:beta-galactosidase n=1 Tax=Hamadaea sp. TaxID=2024425 RepID=UPI0017B0B436|nr:beta-galactosidase [Hamadaea sp.]NUR71040.1 glycosyl hydrolase family 35 [Hamadaea sp.]NUT23721.1 glycosyl hydrolase family 35 [Hamadaea sp.]
MGGGRIAVTSRYLTRDGRPWLPATGEFHFSRYRRDRWREDLLKLRAGGLTGVSSYLFWLHHEETEGELSFAGDLDVRHFAELCAEAGLDFVARIGPWVHAEARNGGLPDWVLAGCVPRSNDPVYLARVRRWYAAVAEQLSGLDHAGGGPVIAVQIDNEYHGGDGHLRTLKDMAQEAGLVAPLWTATAWDGVDLAGTGLLPTYAGYADGFWFDADEGWPESCRTQFGFSHARDGISDGPTEFPFLTCELGGGMATAYHRRPVVTPDDVAAVALTKLGSGANMLGYYMFHGGTNPIGRHSTFQESRATGYPNDLPILSYDFQAPLGEHGQYRRHYHRLRRLHLMLADFGEVLAPMPMVLPGPSPLRWAVRSDGRSAFLFVNNHQPHEPLPSRDGVRFRLELPTTMVELPSLPVTVPAGASFCWPVNLRFAGVSILYATAQPICVVDDDCGRPVLVLAATEGVEAEVVLASGEVFRGLRPGTDCLISIGDDAKVLVLDSANADRLYRGDLGGRRRLLLCADGVVFDGGSLRLHTGRAEPSFSVFPPPSTPPEVAGARVESDVDGCFTRYAVVFDEPPVAPPALPFEQLRAAGQQPERAGVPEDSDFDEAAVYRIDIPAALRAAAYDVLLRLDWQADVGRAYQGDRLVADQFSQGEPWEISLSRLEPGDLTVRLLPVPGSQAELRQVTAVPSYAVTVTGTGWRAEPDWTAAHRPSTVAPRP